MKLSVAKVGVNEVESDSSPQVFDYVFVVRKYIIGLWKEIQVKLAEDKRKSDMFFERYYIERTMINAIIAGQDPEVARFKAIIKHSNLKGYKGLA